MIEEWLESLRSKSTRGVYLSGLRHFVRVVGEGDDLNVFIEQYIAKVKAGHNPFEDLLTYAAALADKPPKTASPYMGGVISFLEYTVDFELSRKQRKLLRNRMPKGKRARTIEDDLTRDRLRKILTHCDTKGKTLFLFLVSSGIRVGESLQLEFDDIDLKSEPAKVNVRGEYTKTGDPYYSLISKEAKESLTEWLKIRGQYLLSSAKRGRGLAKTGYGRGVKSMEDNRIFPFSFSVASSMWNNALKKAGLEKHDKGTNRRTLHIHMLRKFFNSQLKIAVPREIVDALMGHEEGLSEAYRRYPEGEIRKYYLKGEPHLFIFVPQELSKMRNEYDGRLTEVRLQNLELNNKVRELENKLADLSTFMEEKVEEITHKLFDKWMDEYSAELKEARSDFAKRHKRMKIEKNGN